MEAVRSYWYAARTRYGQELKVRDRLEREGVEHFIPTVPSGGARKEKAAISNLVFVKATKSEALELANTCSVPMKYIIDCATRTLLVVPDKQMEDFRRVLDLGLESGGPRHEGTPGRGGGPRAPVPGPLLRGGEPAGQPLREGQRAPQLDRKDLTTTTIHK